MSDEEFDELDPPVWGSQEEESIAKVEADFQATQAAARQSQAFDDGFQPVSKRLKLDGGAQVRRNPPPAADIESQDLLPHMRLEEDRYVANPSSPAAARRSPTRTTARLGPGRPAPSSSSTHHPAIPSRAHHLGLASKPAAPAPAPDDFRISHKGGPPKGIGVAHSRTLANAQAADDMYDEDDGDAIWDVEELDRAEQEAVRSASQATQAPPHQNGTSWKAPPPAMARANGGPPLQQPQQRSFARSISGPAVGISASQAAEAQRRTLGRNSDAVNGAGSSLTPVKEGKGNGGGASLADEVARLKSQLKRLEAQNQELNKKVKESVTSAYTKAGEVEIIRGKFEAASTQAANQAKEISSLKQLHDEQLKQATERHQQELSRLESSMLFEQTALSTSVRASKWPTHRHRGAPPSTLRRGDAFSQSHSQAAAASLGITTPTRRGRGRAMELGAQASGSRAASAAREMGDEYSPSRRGSVKRGAAAQQGRGSDTKPSRFAYNSFVDDAPMPMRPPPADRRGKSLASAAAPMDFGGDDGCLPDMDIEMQLDKAIDAAVRGDDAQARAPPLYVWAVSTYMRRRKMLVATVLAHHSAPLGLSDEAGNDSRLVRHGGGSGEPTWQNFSTLRRILNADVSGWSTPSSAPISQQEEERRYLDSVSALLNALMASAADDAEQRFADLTDPSLFSFGRRAGEDEDEVSRDRDRYTLETGLRIEQGIEGVLDELATALRCLLGVFVRVSDYARLHDVMSLMMHLCIAHPYFVTPLLWSDVVSSSTLDGLTQLSLGGGAEDDEETEETSPASMSSGQSRPVRAAIRKSTDVIKLAATLTARLGEVLQTASLSVATSGEVGEGLTTAPVTCAPTLMLAAPASTSARPVALPMATARGTGSRGGAIGAASPLAASQTDDAKLAPRPQAAIDVGANKGLDLVLNTLVDLLGILTAEVKSNDADVFKPLLGRGSALYTLLDSKRPPLLCARVVGILANLSAHASLWSLVLASESDVSSAVVLRRPNSLKMLDLLATRMVPRAGQHCTDEHHQLHRIAVVFLTQLAIVYEDAARILAESPNILAAIVRCLDLDTSVVWSLDGRGVRSGEGEEGRRQAGTAEEGKRNEKLDALFERVTMDVRLLHLLFSPSRSGVTLSGDADVNGDGRGDVQRQHLSSSSSRRPPVDLASRLANHETSILFNGVRHAFALALSRLAWAEPPEWVGLANGKRIDGVYDLILELLELVLSPDEIEDAWHLCAPSEGDQEEEEEETYEDGWVKMVEVEEVGAGGEAGTTTSAGAGPGMTRRGAAVGGRGANVVGPGGGIGTGNGNAGRAAGRPMGINETDSQTQMEED